VLHTKTLLAIIKYTALMRCPINSLVRNKKHLISN
jgi:hypothetical protein